MADTIMVAMMVGFIAICVAYTRWCDHIIGPDESPRGTEQEQEQVA